MEEEDKITGKKQVDKQVDKSGKFLKKHSGNLNGRPKKIAPTVLMIRKALAKKGKDREEPIGELIAEHLIRKALEKNDDKMLLKILELGCKDER